MNGMRRSQSAPSIQHYANQPAITSYSSSFQYLADNFSGHYPDVEAEEEVDVEDTLIPSPSTAVHGHLEAGVGQFNTMGVEGKTIIDVVAASDSERDSFTKFRKATEGLNYIQKNVGMYHAALKGDWKKAESLIDGNPYLVREAITGDKETALHIAAGAKHTAFVEKLIDRMTPANMKTQNKHGNTALCFAAASGVVRIAELMVKKNKQLPYIRGFNNITPIFIAVSYQHRHMISYLLSVTDLKQLTPQEQIQLLIATIHSDFYDIALEILDMNPKLATMKDASNNNETALHVLAKKPSVIGSRNKLNIWEKFINSNILIRGANNNDVKMILARQLVKLLWRHILQDMPEKEILEFIKHPTRLMHDAARAGNVEFLILIISSYPDIAWEEDDDGKSIFHIAVENRLENVFNLIHEVGGLKDLSTKYTTTVRGKYNMLHLAAKLAAPNHLNRVSGAALQMQRELLWFKEVEKIVLPSQLEAKCDDPYRLTPRELFTKEHKDLRKDGEEWMKHTAHSCMLVATLIATVVFNAAFTVPGGSNSNTGTPILQRNLWFSMFVISDAVALVSSSTSILMFLSILTSSYAEDDFLHSLPSKLLFGLASLFIAIVCMVVAFTATLFMLFYRDNIWVPLTIAAMAIVPITCFFVLQFKLWVDTFHTTYLSKFLFKPGGHKLFSSSASHITTLYHKLRKIEIERRERFY